MTAPAHASLGFRLLSDYTAPMRSEDRLSVIGIVIGFAGGAAASTLPYAFPVAPVWFWQVLFWLFATVFAASAISLAYELAIRPRDSAGTKMDPLLWLSATALLVGIVALGTYIAKGPAPVSTLGPKHASLPQVVAKPAGPDRTQLSPSEKERLGNILYDVAALLQRSEDLVNQSAQFADTRGRMTPAEQRLQLEKTLLDGSRILYEDLFHKYVPTHQYYNFDIYQIIQNDGPLNAFRMSVNDYMVTIDQLAEYDPRKATLVLNGVPYKQLAVATMNLRTWSNESLQRLQAVRREIQ
jgi:hypothetical protein